MISMNSAFVEDLYFEYLRNPSSIASDWQAYFETNKAELAAEFGVGASNGVPSNGYSNGASNGASASGHANGHTASAPAVQAAPQPAVQAVSAPVAAAAPAPAPAAKPSMKVFLGEKDSLVPISGVAERVVDNMESSLNVPVATTIRTMPIKALEENRIVINNHLARNRKKKISFTHIIGWAIVRALVKYPGMNDAFARIDGKPHRVKRGSVNFGLAVDAVRKDGSRGLVVPSVKNSQDMMFSQFIAEYDKLIAKSRVNKLDVNDLSGTTASLTNPGMIGTNASVPRLMEGMGLIVAAGSIDYPAEMKAFAPQMLATMAVSKVMTITNTYDHRIIQGAESGEFLQYIENLLKGDDNFYDQIYASLGIPFEPFKWVVDLNNNPFYSGDTAEVLEQETKVVQLINAYRVRGHLYADMNPLGLQAYYYPELDISYYGLTIWDLSRDFDTGGLGGIKRAPLRDILTMLRDTYCGRIGVEFMHIQELDKKAWVKDRFETVYNNAKYSKEAKVRVLRKLVEAESFEKYIHTKFVGSKRFSVEGGESFVPAIDKIMELAAERGVTDVYMGMAHRGRLNTLINIMGKSAAAMFKKFTNELDPTQFQSSGDVKYHLGAEGKYTHPNGKQININLAPNPSHLEAVNPVVEGMARARIDEIKDDTYSKVLPILIHGDSAMAGLGIVQETLNLARLRAYKTGGTIHIVINNQIGFTTVPEDARSTIYCTDIAKMLQVPILHVNGGEPEEVLTAAAFAIEYRQAFGEDVVIDLLCYRKYGHNEGDEPAYTQPLLYKKIKALPSASEPYRDYLVESKVITKEEAAAIYAEIQQRWDDAFAASKETKLKEVPPPRVIDMFAPVTTSIDTAMVNEIGEKLSAVPANFTPHPKLSDLLKKRGEMVLHDKGMDWGMGEALAFASLVMEGFPVRITGEDSARGTFSHRHSVLTDYNNERDLILLNRLRPDQAQFSVYDSALSEFAVMGYEYGYSVTRPKGLTIWEGQFGDFANGAQTIIDQFLASGEAKWAQTSGLVLLLPHGYEGQGPEHSSARLERFLQLCADDNMIIGNFTTPAQIFHALRRQVKRDFRKPLVVMSPKSMLRNPQAVSHVKDFTEGAFQEVIDDASVKPENVRRVLFSTGKVYYDLLAKRTKLGADDVAIVRLEQIYPFHEAKVRAILQKYERAQDVVWVQEEPKNAGAWTFVAPLFAELLLISQRLRYAGRKASASPATGFNAVHNLEQEALTDAAFGKF
ncbi:MAG: multifunctional oxoglutarate decarboxylase/oxoglutarate dehydrogenase thiamine pyrophosphate-binding subunit/dihydrolipoyllysine-residue succinyltransferase subunit [Candidatus Kapaibacterium sp.]|nr:MAG: multifunctional oxoglutarate decarboxylase/oxoglutarate dehydrogenase thiamine pyrophosphate-binding subunit/dihydrolipoyllysine-residue succinyltransferase subunit [Candidatus Kapabacteria bacterium]